jgi:transposase-like protein
MKNIVCSVARNEMPGINQNSGSPFSAAAASRRVKRITPKFVNRWNRFARSAGRSWRVDEMQVKIRR